MKAHTGTYYYFFFFGFYFKSTTGKAMIEKITQ